MSIRESISALEEYARTLGNWPTAKEWNTYAVEHNLLQKGALLNRLEKSWIQIGESFGYMKVTEQNCLDAILAASEQYGSSITKKQYEEWRKNHPNTPSLTQINRECQSWNRAKEKLGLNNHAGSRNPYTDDQLLEALDAAARDLGEMFTYLQYQEWNSSGTYPSYNSILFRFGSIEEAKKRRFLPAYRVGGQTRYTEGHWKTMLQLFVRHALSREQYEDWAKKNKAPSVQVIYEEKESYTEAIHEVLVEYLGSKFEPKI